jgi:hypothetical protein
LNHIKALINSTTVVTQPFVVLTLINKGGARLYTPSTINLSANQIKSKLQSFYKLMDLLITEI